MLGAREANALRAEVARRLGVLGGVRIREDAELAEVVGVAEQHADSASNIRLDDRKLAEVHLACRAVDR